MAYQDQLKDPRWQKMRLKIYERDEFTCTRCGSQDNTLNAHHKAYESSSAPWAYPDHWITTLCDTCHASVHEGMDEALNQLCQDLKVFGFFPEDIRMLSRAIAKSEPMHLTDVVASAIAFNIQNMQQLMLDAYFKHLIDKSEQVEFDQKSSTNG
jgi:hypothetical protein